MRLISSAVVRPLRYDIVSAAGRESTLKCLQNSAREDPFWPWTTDPGPPTMMIEMLKQLLTWPTFFSNERKKELKETDDEGHCFTWVIRHTENWYVQESSTAEFIHIHTQHWNLSVCLVNKSSYLKNCFHALEKEDVQDVKDEKQWEFGSEECEKPLRCVHVTLDCIINKMIPQVWEILFHKSIQLI